MRAQHFGMSSPYGSTHITAQLPSPWAVSAPRAETVLFISLFPSTYLIKRREDVCSVNGQTPLPYVMGTLPNFSFSGNDTGY